MANHIIPRSVTVIVLMFILMPAFLQMASVRAESELGPGFVGCYPVGPKWQEFLDKDDAVVESVEGCVLHCREFEYATITAGRSCYCSDGFKGITRADDERCNVRCDGNPCQICGERTHYSVYNTTEILKRMPFNGGLSCSQFNGSSKYVYAECMVPTLLTTTMEPYEIPSTMPTRFPTTQIDHEIRPSCSEELVKQCCHSSYSLWLRIVIDVAVMLLVLFLIILSFIVVRFWRNRQRGMFDEWQPRSIHQRRGNESRIPRSGGDLMNRNHSYRNLSGSSTLDRGLESIDQEYASITAQGPATTVCSFDGEIGNQYGSIPDSAKGAMASETCQSNTPLNIRKCNSGEGESSDPDLRMACDQTGNRHARSDLKSKPNPVVKPRQKGHFEDSKVEKNSSGKTKRKSLFEHLPKLPSSRKPSKCDGTSVKSPIQTIDRPAGALCGTEDKANSNVTELLDRCIVSTAEKFLEDPKSNTMPHDIYALPDKSRYGPSKKKSCTMQGGCSVDIELQASNEGYGRFNRLFKFGTSGKSEQRQDEDSSSPEEYSLLKPELKTSDYDKLAHGNDNDGPASTDPTYNIVGDDPGSAFETGEVLYAAVDDDEYALVGEGTPNAGQNGDYEMVAHGQIE
ncbi:uncharacterized protein LOC121430917 [Lytechinus variegatus]|uniref:uncharacterized protein LOC121430917 n=1 Tax=Lytechinus variegatus TaxID=7654 RepID=UPI001BB2C946|nr:uncharacterized protein LOC121430917 [Lytechinus variegatus]